MESATKVPVHPSSRQHPQLQIPESFKHALATGWFVTNEGTALSEDKKMRRGTVVLGLKGRSQRLSVPYTATRSGYKFELPRLIQ